MIHGGIFLSISMQAEALWVASRTEALLAHIRKLHLAPSESRTRSLRSQQAQAVRTLMS
ncbi:MAG: hypothetical protein UX49_C0003G0027 [Candidatus Wolfebacteria bacterium GW2011_GWC2_46_275]|uniref:Uncharacterized protein n=1 Tax=Candidatus Wolfebacteria bacterium GW2011_GWA2_47_9b TaxID=1619005 RepID=A0A0G1U7X8_9BACT|nr:MAG: hypothetical protein UX49_C0003G0027 [Candidatus Wolfebacteria bacterium GW2011_GWC2_46_275]KKU42612.1 MAG: hypothetical protein UX58_C0001G0044 [Candidatus Wolfebacteria bacterium GW2011_GWB2_46_69]KKU54653.1 MAG: hypothetical protein UX76_C0001G0112 [Candidatus Wolfebacteria bacterium GW2011_GWC1_47_103]KKU59176.1 MAG: hypothetical protein UX83_C0007G0024 [Candidatus Wolfebacteria bacterium GW2011_GWE2_47_12]KKU66445.1 MAG: hypothetical protein UX90_C0001G0504 [Candidatus Wolfebacteri